MATQVIDQLARSLGLLSVTVHSRTQAIPFYQRAGYADQPKLLERLFPADQERLRHRRGHP